MIQHLLSSFIDTLKDMVPIGFAAFQMFNTVFNWILTAFPAICTKCKKDVGYALNTIANPTSSVVGKLT